MSDVQYLYKDVCRQDKIKVWFSGSTAVTRGYGLCYDRTYADTDYPATAHHGFRSQVVAVPSVSNADRFAGVAAASYAAVSGGQWIEIFVPGSVCDVYCKENCTVGTTYMTCAIASGPGTATYATGLFAPVGFQGRGSCLALQTIDRSTTAGYCQALLLDGPESGLIQHYTLTTASTGAIALTPVGVTVFDGGAIALAGDVTYTLPITLPAGVMKQFKLVDTITNDIVITVVADYVTTNWTACTGLELDGALDDTILLSAGSRWSIVYNHGTAVS